MQLRLDPALCADSSTASKLLINISNRVDQLQKNFTLNFDALFLSFVQGQARRREWCWGRRASLGGYASTIIPSTEWDSFLFFAFSTCNFTTWKQQQWKEVRESELRGEREKRSEKQNNWFPKALKSWCRRICVSVYGNYISMDSGCLALFVPVPRTTLFIDGNGSSWLAWAIAISATATTVCVGLQP